MAQLSEQAPPFTSEFVGSILAKDSCEMNQSTPCRNSWVFSGCSSNFFLQGKLTGWIRINTLIRSNIMYNCQGRREVGGGPGQFFLGALFKNIFPEKFFFGEQPPPTPSPPVDNFLGKKFFRTSTLQLLSRDFIFIFYAKFRYLPPKNRYLVLCAEIFNTQKGPPAPRGPGQFAPPPCSPLSAALTIVVNG